MPRDAIAKCRITEFDIARFCRRNSVENTYIDEPYYRDGEIAGMRRLLIPLCRSHYDWISRPDELLDLDYEDWLTHNA